MAALKENQHKLELAVHQLQAEPGLQALRALLVLRQVELNDKWFRTQGEDLTLMQGEARHIARLIKMIDLGPTIKTAEGVSNV